MLRLQSISKTYHAKGSEVSELILRSVDLEVFRGDFLAIVGPSGSGKTTLLNIMGLMDRPTDGAMDFQGSQVNFDDESSLDQIRRHQLGFIFQSFNLLGALTCLENVELSLLGRVSKSSETRERAFAALARVGMDDHAHKFPHQLSGGQKQRVAIARAFVHEPALIVADEPTASLDKKNAELIVQYLIAMKSNFRTTIVMASHDEKVYTCADRILPIYEGRIERHG